MYRSILVPLDGSLPSEQALPFAAAIARRSGAALQVVHVHTPLVLGEGAMYLAVPEQQMWEEEKAYLEGVAKRVAGAAGVPVTTKLLEGPVADTLQEHALAQAGDLVVMTTHGHGPVSRFWLGSVADQLVHRLPMPLLLIRTREEVPASEREPTFRHVLIALDGTPAAEEIFTPAVELGKRMGSAYTLLRVVPPPRAPDRHAPGEPPSDLLRAEGHVYLKRVAGSLREQGLQVHTRIVVDAHPASAILEEAAAADCDLIALETHARRGLPRLFLGSVADKVVRGATVPVLVHRCLRR